jgi:glycerol-3-phosphate dehydrogenase
MPNIGEAFPRPYQRADMIADDPAYGRIVCFCERVTEGEVRDACHSVIPPAALEGLRRRTRVMNGRCQAFFCGAEVQALLEREIRAPQKDSAAPIASVTSQEAHR